MSFISTGSAIIVVVNFSIQNCMQNRRVGGSKRGEDLDDCPNKNFILHLNTTYYWVFVQNESWNFGAKL